MIFLKKKPVLRVVEGVLYQISETDIFYNEKMDIMIQPISIFVAGYGMIQKLLPFYEVMDPKIQELFQRFVTEDKVQIKCYINNDSNEVIGIELKEVKKTDIKKQLFENVYYLDLINQVVTSTIQKKVS